MEFLPTNYETPKASNNYLKLLDGENRIRILSKPIIGWEDWKDSKPIRYRLEEKPKPFDPKKPVKHFWSFIVHNVMEDRIQIMHVTQATIRRSLEALVRDPDWGAPYNYDIKINRSGEGMDTEYHINPVPHKKVEDRVIQMFKETPCNLDALFVGDDPFAEWASYTPIFSEDKPQPKAEKSDGKVASKDMIEDFYSEAIKFYAIKDIEAYIKDWCDHWQLTEAHAIYSLYSDFNKFKEKITDWLETRN